MAEMLASPTASVPAGDDLRSPALRDQQSGSALPFEFPLEPSRKTVRSQSYSAGQLERGSGSENMPPFGFSRSRTGITTRSSRPSMRGGGDGLASLQEDVNDEEDSSNGSDQGVRLTNRNDAASEFSTALHPTLSEDSSWAHQRSTPGSSQFGGFRTRRVGPLPTSPDSDYAIEEHDVIGDSMSDRGRSMVHTITSSASSSTTAAPALLNQRLEDVRSMQPQWTSRLGFDVPGIPESRRHSFATATVPRERMGLTGQLPEPHYALQHEGINGGPVAMASHMNGRDGHQREAATEDRKSDISNTIPTFQTFHRIQRLQEQVISQEHNNDRQYAAAYFSGAENHRRHLRESTEDFNPFAVPSVYSRPGRVLYIVSFKCKRADIFYIPDNTGLSVKAGDTVIVEGDRGQDLGTVEHANVTMDQAKKYKEEYTKQHFKCLMMFSRFYPHVAALANNDELFNETIGRHAANPGGVGGVFEPEPRPKMIKRVAKPDEVHLLREKEGNEAKAKRMCQNKVSEHNLRMEILDAEFQQ
jgi:PSP1 C-terminal conserved region